MIFSVTATAMNGSEPALNKLDALLKRIEEDVHVIEIQDADVLEESQWYQASRPERRLLLMKIATAMIHRSPRVHGPHVQRYEIRDEGAAAQACEVAYTPLYILVENDNSDGRLVRFALMAFASRETLDLCYGSGQSKTPKACEIESRGGSGELKKLIEKRADEAVARGFSPRIVVAADSDGEWPGDIKQPAQEIRDTCGHRGVACPPFDKRTAENYVPDGVWTMWASQPEQTNIRPAIEALMRLSPVQRDHVKLDKSNTPPWKRGEPKAAALFSTVSTSDEALLIATSLKKAAASALDLALSGGLSASAPADILSRDPVGELQTLARSIEDYL
jgi:hypothetical protein